MRNLIKNNQGFTLLEIIIVLMVLSILGAALAPPVYKALDDAREEATKKEMETICRAIYGDPDRGEYGYIGDMGELPDTLADLNTLPGGADLYTSSGRVNSIGIGWNGPYLNVGYGTDEYLTDGWGRDYVYSGGQIISKGSDGVQGTADDLTVPPDSSIDTTGEISVIVTVFDDARDSLVTVDNSYATVNIYYPEGGTESLAQSVAWDGSVFHLDDIPYGIHAVEVSGAGTCTGTVRVNAAISRGTTSITVFLGTCAL